MGQTLLSELRESPPSFSAVPRPLPTPDMTQHGEREKEGLQGVSRRRRHWGTGSVTPMSPFNQNPRRKVSRHVFVFGSLLTASSTHLSPPQSPRPSSPLTAPPSSQCSQCLKVMPPAAPSPCHWGSLADGLEKGLNQFREKSPPKVSFTDCQLNQIWVRPKAQFLVRQIPSSCEPVTSKQVIYFQNTMVGQA